MPTQRIAALEERLDRVVELLEQHSRELAIQFQRIAQIQAQLDEQRIASANVKESRRSRAKDH